MAHDHRHTLYVVVALWRMEDEEIHSEVIGPFEDGDEAEAWVLMMDDDNRWFTKPSRIHIQPIDSPTRHELMCYEAKLLQQGIEGLVNDAAEHIKRRKEAEQN